MRLWPLAFYETFIQSELGNKIFDLILQFLEVWKQRVTNQTQAVHIKRIHSPLGIEKGLRWAHPSCQRSPD